MNFTTTNMAQSPVIKTEIIDIEDNENESTISGNSQKEFDATPAWILEFSEQCLKINGLRCPEKLDHMMGEYLELMRVELLQCQISPNRSYHIACRMQKFLAFFYGYYLDIKEYFVVTQWNENMVELLAIYSYLELKAAIRLNRRDTDQTLASRIFKMLYLYFEGNEEHIIHTFLKTPIINLKCKNIYDLIFRKVLVTNRTNRSQTHTELEYIRNLLCYKIWKTMYPKIEKKIVTNFALAHNKPPSNLAKNIRKFRFIPKHLDQSDLHRSLCTVPFQIEDGIREYFERLKTKNGQHFGSVSSKEKKTFISRLFDVFSITDSCSEGSGDSFMDNLLLDQIKTETEEIRLDDDENSDDDCVFVDPNAPPAPPPPDPPLAIVIDLTNNEPNLEKCETTTDLTPNWCKKLVAQAKIVEEEELLLSEPEPDTEVCEAVQHRKTETNTSMDCATSSHLECVPVDKLGETVKNKTDFVIDALEDFEPVNKVTDCEPLTKKDFEVIKPLEFETVENKVDFQPVNSTYISCKPVDIPKMDCEAVNNITRVQNADKDFESVKSMSIEMTDKSIINYEPENLEPVDCEPDKRKTVKNSTLDINSVINNLISGYSIKDTVDFEPINNNVVISNSVKYNTDNCSSINSEPVNKTVNCELEDPITRNTEHMHSKLDFNMENALEVEDYLNDLQTAAELCEPVNGVINRENINKTPLDIIDDFCSSDEDNGLPEITSTSHDFAPVKQTPLSIQTRQQELQSPMPSSSNQSLVGFNKLPLQSSTNGIKQPAHVSKKGLELLAGARNDWGQNFDKADSTSTLNEDTLHSRNTEHASDESLNPGEVTPVFEVLPVKQSTDHSIEMIVSAPKIATKVHDLSKLVPHLTDLSDSESESSSTEDNLIINSHNTTLEDAADVDELSPAIEPISKNDYVNYLNHFTPAEFPELQRECLQPNSELIVNKTVKIRTYNPRPKPTPVVAPRETVIAEPERRVPVNGEKVLRFETEIWEPVFLKTFKLTKKEFQLFNPQVKVHKSDKRDFGIHEDDIEPVLSYHGGGKLNVSAVKTLLCNGYETPHCTLYNVAKSKTKTILERQDYVKGEKQTRALVQTRPLRTKGSGGGSLRRGEATTSKHPDAVAESKKRGIDLNLLFSSADCSVSLNNSFQHHFCSDISTCSSNCFSPTLNLATSDQNGQNYATRTPQTLPNPQLSLDQPHPQLTCPNPPFHPNICDAGFNLQLQTVPTYSNPLICDNKIPASLHHLPDPRLIVPHYPNLCDKIPPPVPSGPSHSNAHPTLLNPQLSCDKLPTIVPNHPKPMLHEASQQFNLRVCDEFNLKPVPPLPAPQINLETHFNPVTLSQSEPKQDTQVEPIPNKAKPELKAGPSHPSLLFNPDLNVHHPKVELSAQSDPVLLAAPQPAPVPDLNTYWQNVDPDQMVATNLLFNINLDQSSSDHEIHLPIKKRRVSSLKLEIKDELSYPCTPMISIAELESIKTEQRNLRPFKTPAELKEVPPLPPSYLVTVPNHMVTENLNINHTFNNPTINYHVNNVPVINFQYTPHYHQLPPLQPILVPVSRTTNWQQPAYSYMPAVGKGQHTSATGKKRNSKATERKKAKTKS